MMYYGLNQEDFPEKFIFYYYESKLNCCWEVENHEKRQNFVVAEKKQKTLRFFDYFAEKSLGIV